MAAQPKNVPPDAMPCSAASADQALVEKSSSPAETTKTTHITQTIETTELPCPLLELSAELRNKIWEAYYCDVENRGLSTDLLTATGPSSALLATCRQVNSEARGFHETAQRSFWQDELSSVDLSAVGRDDGLREAYGHNFQIRGSRGKGFELIQRRQFGLCCDEDVVHCASVWGTNMRAWTIRTSQEYGAIIFGRRSRL